MYQSNYGYYQPAQMPGVRQTIAPQAPVAIPQQQPILKGRPVSSLEEARATTIDFDGSVFFFPDLANKKIYTKQINVDGTASLNMYELQPLPMPSTTNENNNYVTREEFEKVLTELQQKLLSVNKNVVQTNTNPSEQQPVPQFNF